jgi:hypothetical protein
MFFGDLGSNTVGSTDRHRARRFGTCLVWHVEVRLCLQSEWSVYLLQAHTIFFVLNRNRWHKSVCAGWVPHQEFLHISRISQNCEGRMVVTSQARYHPRAKLPNLLSSFYLSHAPFLALQGTSKNGLAQLLVSGCRECSHGGSQSYSSTPFSYLLNPQHNSDQSTEGKGMGEKSERWESKEGGWERKRSVAGSGIKASTLL